MSTRAERIRAILKQEETPKENKGSGTGAIYPFWNLKPGQSSIVRFLPDGDTSNTLPWVENQQINLYFPGIIGETPKNVRFKVPCMEMFGLADPILAHIRKEKWFDDEDTKDMGSRYWKKYTHLMQGFVVEDGTGEEDAPENPIRRFSFGPQVFGPIRKGYADPDYEEAIDDYQEGVDFAINCESGGQWDSYTTSGFKRKSRSLSSEEMEAIETFGLSSLKDFRPKQPTPEESAEIFEMFEASVAGEFYDPSRWGHLPWRPRGVEGSDTKTPVAKPTTVSAKEPVEEKTAPEVTTASTDDHQTRASDILARIKNKS